MGNRKYPRQKSLTIWESPWLLLYIFSIKHNDIYKVNKKISYNSSYYCSILRALSEKPFFSFNHPGLLALRESHNPYRSLSDINSCDSQRGIETKISGKR